VTGAPNDLIRSLQRGLRVLEQVVAAGRPVTTKELAHALDLNVATAHHLVNTLLYEGYLERAASCRGLVPGPRVGAAGGPAPRVPRHAVAVDRALGRAAFAVDDVALLTTLTDGGEALVTAVEEVHAAPNAGRYRAGTTHLPHLTAVGQAILAAQPDEAVLPGVRRVRALARERDELFEEERLLRDLAATRRRGVAVAWGDGEACLGCAVRDGQGALVGGLALVVTPDRLRREPERLAALARSAAARVGCAVPTPAAPPLTGPAAS
jgi:DNA-binding IclR family transcriptional regulator